jgi:signal transduction histidine kinase
VRNALTSAKQLLTLINDLLDITKIEAGQMNFLIENHDVEDMFQEVYSITHVHAQQKQLKYTLALRGADQLTIRADIHKTVQVLVNLVGNAFKFTDTGGVEVFAEPDPNNEDLVRFTVQDTGIGVPMSQQRQIFEKFIQADGSATRRHQGTGLGLAITKNLVEMMGGTIGIYSEGEGLGTTLTFTLPSALNLPEQQAVTLSDEDLDELLPDTF